MEHMLSFHFSQFVTREQGTFCKYHQHIDKEWQLGKENEFDIEQEMLRKHQKWGRKCR